MEFFDLHNRVWVGGGQGWGNIIKYQLEYVPPIQLGLLPSTILNIEKMLKKLSIHKKGIKWPCHYTQDLVF